MNEERERPVEEKAETAPDRTHTEADRTHAADRTSHSAEDSPSSDRSARTTVASAVSDAASAVVDAASAVADAASPVISAVGSLAAGARRIIDERPGARVRRVRRMGRAPLANLWEVHADAARATPRDYGFHAIPVDRIAGTAVAGQPQRGGDFLPLKDRRGEDWQARWQRILRAIDSLENLPPIEVIKYGDEYWVLDGHNRVAAALYNGQPEIDAVVHELRRPGQPASGPTPLIAGVVEDSIDLRDAGSGRRTPTVARSIDRVRTRRDFADGLPDGNRGKARDR